MNDILNIIDNIFSKRQKFIITSAATFFGFILLTQRAVIIEKKYYYIAIFALIIYILSLWSMRQAMTKTKAVLLFILPIGYLTTFLFFYYLTPIRWLTRLPLAIIVALSYYCLLLTQNVFHVAMDRLIPLYRAANTANFIYTFFTLILIHCIIYSFQLPFYLNGLLIFITSLPLVMQALWATKIEGFSAQVVAYSVVFSLILAEGGVALSFWQAPPLLLSLYLNSITYSVLGVCVEVLKDRLNNKVVFEYGLVSGILFIVLFSLTYFIY